MRSGPSPNTAPGSALAAVSQPESLPIISTIVTAGTDEILEQIEKQLNKLIDVISVEDVTLLNHIERGLALLKVKTTRDNRSEIIQLVETFRGKVLNIKSDVIYVEISGSPEHIDNFIELMEDFGILEVSRAGRTAIRKD